MTIVYEFLFGPNPTDFQVTGIQIMFWFFVVMCAFTFLAEKSTDSYERNTPKSNE